MWGIGDSASKEAIVDYSLTEEWRWINTLYGVM